MGGVIVAGRMVADYVASRIGKNLVEPYAALGNMREGRIVAGVVFNSWTGPDIEITVASEPGGLTRRLLRECADYTWHRVCASRVSITTESPEVVALAQRLGGVIEGVKRHGAGPGRDAVIIGILKGDWTIQ